jgi:hypothetical protein
VTKVRIWRHLGGWLSNMLGAMLVLVGVALAAVNAHGVLQYEAALATHGGQVLDLGASAQVQASLHGQMVRVVGKPRVVESPRDTQFNLAVDTPLLTRTVEMFQWREVRVGSGVHYEMDWVDHWIDASAFRQPRGHANPPRAPLHSERFVANLVQLGGYRLSTELQRALPGMATVPPPGATLPENLAASFSVNGDYLQTSASPRNPQLGDLRVSWSAVPRNLVTVVARVDGDTLRPAADASDGQGYQLALGDVSVFDLFPDLPTPPVAVAWKRGLAVVLAALGAFVLLSVRRRALVEPLPRHGIRDDLWLALGAGALVVGAITALLWLGHDPWRLGWWLAIAMGGAVLAGWQVRRRCTGPRATLEE